VWLVLLVRYVCLDFSMFHNRLKVCVVNVACEICVLDMLWDVFFNKHGLMWLKVNVIALGFIC
jgi:hypothetical protein